MRSTVLRSPFLWVGVLLLLALIGALVFSDGVAELSRFSADYQRRIQQSLSTSLRDIRSGSGSLALWTLVAVCFGYGVVHTLGGQVEVVAKSITKPGVKLASISSGDLFYKSNYQNFQRYQDVDLSIPADAEATCTMTR